MCKHLRLDLDQIFQLVQCRMAHPDVCEDLTLTVNTASNPFLGVLIHLCLAFLLTLLDSDTSA